ncbi:MAG: MBL fold metallo-hydrolase [Tagaea sp.]|nr:MBL fold metallo-hydrolase [Tagaea sp.]
MPEPDISAVFDPITGTLSYIVADRAAKRAIAIDPVLDYDWKSGRISTASAEKLAALVGDCALDWVIETHAHADHLSAAPWLKAKFGAKTAIGSHIAGVQATWGKIFDLGPDFAADGRQFDRLLRDGDTLAIGGLTLTVWNTPGHTPACKMLLVEGASGAKHVFLGDTLFMPDLGTARCDFPGGSARTLYRSIRRVLALPGETLLYVCHDYPPEGREMRWRTTVAEQRAANIHVKDGIGEDAYVAMREARDKTLPVPTLLLPSIQVNIRAGELPPAAANGVRYLKIPLDAI